MGANELDCVVTDLCRQIREGKDEITRLREENARLREALKPFADGVDELEKSPLTKYACATSVEIEHLRAARAAIAKARGETRENSV